MRMRNPLHVGLLSVLGLSLLLVAGCGSGGKLSVTGKVTSNGAPVTAGSVTFFPIAAEGNTPGKPASGNIQADGTYKLGTDGEGDGAPAGRYRVSYSAPPAEFPAGVTPTPGMSPPRSPFDGLVPQKTEVDVASGASTIDLELVPAQ